jgi:hypothetical protein
MLDALMEIFAVKCELTNAPAQQVFFVRRVAIAAGGKSNQANAGAPSSCLCHGLTNISCP